MARPRFDDMGEVMADPFAALARVRAAGPIVDGVAGAIVARHDDVRALLADGRMRANFTDFLQTFGVTEGPFYDWMARSPLNRDGAEHLRWRALMAKTFTPRSVERLRPFLRGAAHELIDAFAPAGRCDFMAAFADVYPSLGLCELIGVPAADRDRFRGWADTIGLGFSPLVGLHIAQVDAALTQLLAYAGELADRRRAAPEDDLVSRLAVAAREDGWSDLDVRSFIAGLVFAGHETTKNQLGWSLAVLAERPDLWDALGSGTVAVGDVVEEVLRHRSAVTGVGRTAVEPVPVGDARLEPGERVFLSAWSANHDERVYPHPDTLDPAQVAVAPHLAFGHGAHFCLGAALARAELQEALRALTTRLACPRLEAGARWRPPLGINGPEALPIAFAPR